MWFRSPRQASRSRRVHAPHALIAAGTAVGLLLAAGAAILIIASYRDNIAAAARHLTTLSLVLAEETDRDFQAAELVQVGLIQSMRQDGIDTQDAPQRVMGTYAVNQALLHRIEGLPQISALSVIDRPGRLVNASNSWPIGQIDVSDRAFFLALTADPARSSYISEPVRDRLTGAWTILLSRVVRGPDGQLIGFVDVLIDLAVLEQFYSHISANGGPSVSLFRRDGVLLARYPHLDGNIGKAYGPNPDFLELLAQLDRGIMRRASMIDGQQRLIAPRSVAHFPLVVAVTNAKSAALAAWWHQTLWLMGATSFAEPAMGWLIVLGLRRMRDQARLNSAYAAVLEAEAGRAVAESELAMAQEREQRTQDARRQARRFNDAADNMLQGLLMVDGAERVLVGNRRLKEIFGVPEAAIIVDRSIDELADLVVAHGKVTRDELRALGVRIALDDFGTGYSSLSYLRRFPFDRIKIDQSFVRELGGSRDCSAIVRAVVQLSRDLGMATTAEGVETREQLRTLAAAGCTDIQGYLFSRPVPGPAIRDLLRTLPSVDDLLFSPPAAPLKEACLAAQ